MKKAVKISLLTIVIAIVGYGTCGVFGLVPLPKFITEMFANTDSELTDMERIPLIIQKEFPTELILLGNDIPFETDVPVRKISDVTEAALKSDGKYQYTFFIINDLDGKIQLTKEDIDLITTQISKPNFCLTYLGTQYSTTWDDQSQYLASLEGNLFWRYFQIDNNPRRCIGAWTQNEQQISNEHPYMLGSAILYEIESYLLEVN